MRWIFGLGGLVITLAVIVWMMSADNGPGGYTRTTLKAGKNAQDEARVLAGVDSNGMHNNESIEMEPVTSGSQTKGMRVTALVPGGPMQAHFGLMLNDVIIDVGGWAVRDMNDAETAEAQIWEASQRSKTLTVQRNNALFELPGNTPVTDKSPIVVPDQAPAPLQNNPAVNADTSATPPAVTPVAPPRRNTIRGQLDNIPGIPKQDN